MKKRRVWVMAAASSSLIALRGLVFGAEAEAQSLWSPPLSVYASPKTYCGDAGIPQNVAAIPWIGCFSLSAGHAATGTLSGQHAVDANGDEDFTVNGTSVVYQRGPQRPASGTNLPLVHTMGVAGYSFCKDATDIRCPSSITVFSRNPDKSVLFMVAECLPPTHKMCVLTQQTWDYYMSRLHQ
jgi:hypothetical protein